MASAAVAQAACPNQSTSVSVPYPTGSADVIVYDKDSCNTLRGTDLVVKSGGSSSGPVLDATTKPAVTFDAAGFHLQANGAPYGAAVSLYVVHIPSNTAVTITANVGATVTGIVAGTTTP